MGNIVLLSGLSMSEDSKIVVLEIYNYLPEAHLAEAKLLASGIPCYLTDIHMSGMYASWGQPVGGIRLMVFEKDIPAAKTILLSNEDA